MSVYAKIADALRFTASAISDHKLEVLSLRTLNDGATAIEELTAQVRDKDCLIQQQTEEIERLRRDVKKQQEKMFELAKARELKETEAVKTWCHQRGIAMVDWPIYRSMVACYGRDPVREKKEVNEGMTVLEKAKAKLDAAQRGMSYRLPGYDKSDLQWWTAYIEGAEDQKREDAEAVGQLIAKYDERAKEAARFDIRQLPEGFYTIKDGVVYTARVKVSGGNVLNLKTGESHWEDDRIVGGEQVFPKLPRKGKWSVRHDPDDYPRYRRKFVCSACGSWTTYGMTDYCPNCGAEMERPDEE